MDVKKAIVSGEVNIPEETDGNNVTFEKDLIYFLKNSHCLSTFE